LITPRPQIGSKVRYKGSNYQLGKICGKKWLEVVAVGENDEGIWVTASHPALVVAQTMPLAQVIVKAEEIAS
jgi:hypothetical protein